MTETTVRDDVKAKPEATNGRDSNGRFAPGNKLGPGNPFARRVAALRKALLSSVTDEDMKAMVQVLKDRAKEGDVAAIKLLFQYTLGKPTATPDPDRLDQDEWSNMQEKSRGWAEFAAVVGGVPAATACDLTNATWPCLFEKQFGGPFRAGLKALDERDARRAKKKEKAKGDSDGKGKPPSPVGANGNLGDLGDPIDLSVLFGAMGDDHQSGNGTNGRTGRQ